MATRTNSWERPIWFLQSPPMLRKVIYTTNSIKSLNSQLRKITTADTSPPSDAAVKLLRLAICTIEDKHALEQDKEHGKPTNQHQAPGRLAEGQIVTNWKQALAQLTTAYPHRINPYP